MKKVISILMVVSIISIMLSSCSVGSSDNKQDFSDIKITYDSIYSYFDSSTIRAYESLCNAVIKGEEEVGMNIGMLSDVCQMFYTSFPLSALVENIDINNDKSGVKITYKNATQQHLECVKQFSDIVKNIVNKCSEGCVNKAQYAVKVYDYISMNTSYSKSNNNITVYDTVMKSVGDSFSISSMFEYLLLQNDINTCHILTNKKSGALYGMTQAEICGELYYFDVNSECESRFQHRLKYFAMTTQDIMDLGYTDFKYLNGADATDVSDMKFQPCRNCDSWEFRDGDILINDGSDVVVQIELS